MGTEGSEATQGQRGEKGASVSPPGCAHRPSRCPLPFFLVYPFGVLAASIAVSTPLPRGPGVWPIGPSSARGIPASPYHFLTSWDL